MRFSLIASGSKRGMFSILCSLFYHLDERLHTQRIAVDGEHGGIVTTSCPCEPSATLRSRQAPAAKQSLAEGTADRRQPTADVALHMRDSLPHIRLGQAQLYHMDGRPHRASSSRPAFPAVTDGKATPLWAGRWLSPRFAPPRFARGRRGKRFAPPRFARGKRGRRGRRGG